jgi:tRNA wybutosine-synthesizing protein 1
MHFIMGSVFMFCVLAMDSDSNVLLQVLKAQKYHLVGEHSAVKRCRWLYESLVHSRVCYKQRFYGIKSHRCVQMTPSILNCTMHCRFCWRVQSGDSGLKWTETSRSRWDTPEKVVEGCLKAQQKLLSGYKGNTKASREKYREALTPKHAAISLAGEPTLYPSLSGLIGEFHRRGLTTFLVSNGTVPEALSRLDKEPTQLYVSLCAPNRSTFIKTCRPQIPNAWEKLNETLGVFPSLSCRKVVRITLVRGFNMGQVEEYAKLIGKASPDFVEPKAYMHVGFSRLRLGFENMPSHREIRAFADNLAEETAYKMLDEAPESRVALLSRIEKPKKLA